MLVLLGNLTQNIKSELKSNDYAELCFLLGNMLKFTVLFYLPLVATSQHRLGDLFVVGRACATLFLPPNAMHVIYWDLSCSHCLKIPCSDITHRVVFYTYLKHIIKNKILVSISYTCTWWNKKNLDKTLWKNHRGYYKHYLIKRSHLHL